MHGSMVTICRGQMSPHVVNASACIVLAIASCRTMRFGGTAKALAKCKLKYYSFSECAVGAWGLRLLHSLRTPAEAGMAPACIYTTNQGRHVCRCAYCCRSWLLSRYSEELQPSFNSCNQGRHILHLHVPNSEAQQIEGSVKARHHAG